VALVVGGGRKRQEEAEGASLIVVALWANMARQRNTPSCTPRSHDICKIKNRGNSSILRRLFSSRKQFVIGPSRHAFLP
jgi:hypothetical protein